MSTPNIVVVLGDFNANCKDTVPPHLQRIMYLNNLHQLVKEITRNASGTLIDLILTPSPALAKKTGVLPAIKSDHCCIFIEKMNGKQANSTFTRTLFNYSKLNLDKYLEELTAVDWNVIINSGTVDTAAESFTDNLLSIAKRCMPVKEVKIRENDAPWINDDIKKLIRKKRNIHSLAKLLDSVWCWQWFRTVRNNLTTRIRDRKEEFTKELENKINSDEAHGTKIW